LRELTPLHPSLPQNLELILLSLLFKSSFLGCAPLFSYMDSKGHHHESSHPLGVSCPFMNHHTQTNHHTPSWTHVPQMNPCALIITSLGTNTPQPWCTPHVDAPQPLWCTPSLGHFHASPHAWESPLACSCPRCPLSQLVQLLGVQSNPKFCLLEDLGEGLHAPSSRRPYILPHLKSFSSPTTSTKSVISKSLPELMPPSQLSLLETPSFMPTGNPKFLPKWKPQVSLQSGNPKFPTLFPKLCATNLSATWKDISSPTLSAMSKLPLSLLR
jgi:hypothetical protein